MGPGKDALDLEPGVQFADAIRANDLHLETNIGRKSCNVAEPVHFLGRGGDADAAAAVPAGRMTGQRLQPGVQRIAVVMDLGHVVIADEGRALPGGVPG